MDWVSLGTTIVLILITAGALLSMVGLGAALAMDGAILSSTALMALLLAVGITAGVQGRTRPDSVYW